MIVGEIVGGRIGRVGFGERKFMLIERDMSRDVYAMCFWVETAVAFVLHGIANENTRKRSWCKFVRGLGADVWKTEATIYA